LKQDFSISKLDLIRAIFLSNHTLQAAGQDTTSGALCWIALLLVQHPECQRKLQAELRACHELEEIDSSIFTHDLLSSLSYLDAVIKEG
jgi:cytochrome P450